MHMKRAEPVKSFNPKFEEEGYVQGRDYDPDRQRAEQRKLKKLIKKCVLFFLCQLCHRTLSTALLEQMFYLRQSPDLNLPAYEPSSCCHLHLECVLMLFASHPLSWIDIPNREEKGAARELRKDNYFLAEEKQRQKDIFEEGREQKTKEVMSFLQKQEADFKSGGQGGMRLFGKKKK
eukprot:9485167-Pyramimonas_sp.AAC.1